MKNLKRWLSKRIYRYREMQDFDVDLEQMKRMTKQGAVLIDVRSPQEYNEGHINGAILIPDYEIKKRINNIITNKQQPIILYCSTGNRSKKVQKELIKDGFSQIYNLYNGLENTSFNVFWQF